MATDQAEVDQTARGLIERYGSDAPREAAQSESDAISQRDAEAITFWREVAKAIGRLARS
jgi:hypothetical protein